MKRIYISGKITGLDMSEAKNKFQYDLGKFIADAINEKLERVK